MASGHGYDWLREEDIWQVYSLDFENEPLITIAFYK